MITISAATRPSEARTRRRSLDLRRRQHTVVVHATTGAAPDRWEHVVHGDGDDRGLVYLLRFAPLREALDLLVDHLGEFLDALEDRSGPANTTVPGEPSRS